MLSHGVVVFVGLAGDAAEEEGGGGAGAAGRQLWQLCAAMLGCSRLVVAQPERARLREGDGRVEAAHRLAKGADHALGGGAKQRAAGPASRHGSRRIGAGCEARWGADVPRAASVRESRLDESWQFCPSERDDKI